MILPIEVKYEQVETPDQDRIDTAFNYLFELVLKQRMSTENDGH